MTAVTYERHDWTEPPTFWRVFWAVVRGYVLALCTLAIPLLALSWSGFVGMDQSSQHPGPFPVTDAWSLAADVVLAAVVILVAAYWIRREVRDSAWRPVSYPVVVGVVALTGYAPLLAMRPFELSGVVALPLSAWLVKRFAVGREHPVHVPVKAVLGAALVGAAVVASYLLYHPLWVMGVGSGDDGAGGTVQILELQNSGLSTVHVLSIAGARVVSSPFDDGQLLPATLRGRGHARIYLRGNPCGVRQVTVRFEVLGRTSSRPFGVQGRSCG